MLKKIKVQKNKNIFSRKQLCRIVQHFQNHCHFVIYFELPIMSICKTHNFQFYSLTILSKNIDSFVKE